MATLFSVSWTYKYFMGSLLSIPLHRLELISFWQHLATSVAMATLTIQLTLWHQSAASASASASGLTASPPKLQDPETCCFFTPQPLRAVGVLFSPMVSGWADGHAAGKSLSGLYLRNRKV